MNWRTTDPALKRLLCVLFGLLYLFFVSNVLSAVSQLPLRLSQVITAVAAVLIAVTMMVLAERYSLHHGSRVKFSISTMMLMVVPLSIYLAAARLCIIALLQGNEAHGLGIAFLVLAALPTMIVTTAILLLMTESIMWFLVRIRRKTRGR